MNKDIIIKHKKKIIIVIIILAISLIGITLMNSTYSLFYHENIASNTDSYTTGLLSITATEGEVVTLANTLPISDTAGASTTPYTFTITNTGNLDYKFDIKLLSTGDSSTTINSSYIKVKVDNANAVTLSSLTNSIIKEDVLLEAGQSISISIRVWLSTTTPNTEIGKTFYSKIVTDGEAVYTSTNNSIYASYTGLAKTIADLYTSSPKTKVVSNNITYRYDTTNNLMVDIDNNIRYYGSNPNNYIYFNCDDYSNQSSTTCELWRIIGVFNGKVKIMRNSSIGVYSWDNKNTSTGAESNYGKNDWSDARLMKLLNSGYESESVGGSLYWNAGSGTCYSGYNNATTTCDFTSTGLKNATTRNLISENTYSLLGHNNSSEYTDVMYNKERTTGSVYSTTPARSTSWTGKVALAYPSDYGYAADLSQCNQTLWNYDDSTCTSNNWMRNVFSSGGWLLTPYSGNSYNVWLVHSGGNANNRNYYASNAWAVAPVLYLNSKQAIGSGNGSNNLPFQLTVT